jgi:hypothetical protein
LAGAGVLFAGAVFANAFLAGAFLAGAFFADADVVGAPLAASFLAGRATLAGERRGAAVVAAALFDTRVAVGLAVFLAVAAPLAAFTDFTDFTAEAFDAARLAAGRLLAGAAARETFLARLAVSAAATLAGAGAPRSAGDFFAGRAALRLGAAFFLAGALRLAEVGAGTGGGSSTCSASGTRRNLAGGMSRTGGA